jgi:hypothetical protein
LKEVLPKDIEDAHALFGGNFFICVGVTFNKVKPVICAMETLLPPDKAVFNHQFRLVDFAYHHTFLRRNIIGKAYYKSV